MLKHFIMAFWVFLALGVACYAKTNLVSPDRITLLVSNEGLDVVKIYDPYGRIATVLPGHPECVVFTRTYMGSVNFYIRAGNDEAVTPQIDPSTSKGWEITISTMPLRFAAISLIPTDQPCKR